MRTAKPAMAKSIQLEFQQQIKSGVSMKKNLVIVTVLAVMVGVSVVFVMQNPSDPSGHATGISKTSLHSKLLQYEDSHLSAWSGALQEESPAALDILEAWSELAYKVTGKTGFWRDTVQNQWMGCQMEPDAPACRKLNKMASEFREWEEVQQKIETLSERSARRYLRRNGKKLADYVDRYVPAEMSDSGMRSTGIYRDSLADVFDGDSGDEID